MTTFLLYVLTLPIYSWLVNEIIANPVLPTTRKSPRETGTRMAKPHDLPARVRETL